MSKTICLIESRLIKDDYGTVYGREAPGNFGLMDKTNEIIDRYEKDKEKSKKILAKKSWQAGLKKRK